VVSNQQTKPASMKNIFSQVKDSLKSLYPQEPTGHALTRLNSLCGLITGMLLKKKCHLPDLGSGLLQNIDMASSITHAKRFLSNKWVDVKVYYLPFLESFLKHYIHKVLVNNEVKLTIDGSQMGSKHVALVVSLVWENRSIPICWLVRKGKKGHFPEEMHLDVVKQAAEILKTILPPKTKVVLLGDGEFDSVDLQKLCRNTLGWNYVFRTSCDAIMYENGDEFQAKDTTVFKRSRIFFLSGVSFSKAKFPDVSFLHWHDYKYTDPIYLISTFDNPFDIQYYYKFRFAIETMFKDLKTRGFNLHKTRLLNAFDISNLLIIGSLSFCFIMGFGTEHQNSPLRKKVQEKKKGQKQLSIFSYGLKLFHYLIEKQIDFVFSLTISKNSA
jgi:Transposase DDE domain